MPYSHMGNPHYHRRKIVSLLSSEWNQVGPTLYRYQALILSYIFDTNAGNLINKMLF